MKTTESNINISLSCLDKYGSKLIDSNGTQPEMELLSTTNYIPVHDENITPNIDVR